ncbi:MAG: GNAT family N-acetyltransferase, partial [Anaerolineae bacterium]|nr:GNAT family N-acetyltransferase [Anaerolineae bacterium]
RWMDLEALFGPRGAVGGCWCMWFRLTSREYERSSGEENHRLFKQVVDSGSQPGVLAYVDGNPAGWCAVAPRAEYPRYKTSRVARSIDDQPVWVISCLFIGKQYRGQGLMTCLIDAAAAHASRSGAAIVEAYPVDTQGKSEADAFLYHGTFDAFERAGFTEVARHTPRRPVTRKQLSP